jgi:hypothetical protein
MYNLIPTGVYNINTSSRPTGTTRQHIKSNNVILDSNRGGKIYIVNLATPPRGNTRQQALRKLRKDRYGWCCVHCTQHHPSRWKRPLCFMAIGIHLVLWTMYTALDALLEAPAVFHGNQYTSGVVSNRNNTRVELLTM